MELWIIICLSLAFPLGAFYGYILTKRRKADGTRVLESAAARQADRIRLSRTFAVTAEKKWCRVRCRFTWRNPAGRCDERLHRYRLSMHDGSGSELYSEERSMTEFSGSCWYGRDRKASSAAAVQCLCDAVLFEFLPPAPGRYTVALDLCAEEGPSELADFTLVVSENVRPLKGKPYAHACVELEKKA